MKMSKVFGRIEIGSFERIVCEVGEDDIGEFDSSEQAEAAAHAINCHDELVEVLQNIVDEFGYCMDLNKAKDALEKDKG